MNNPMKLFLAGVTVLSVMGAIAFFGLSPFGKTVVQQVFGSPAGTTFGTAKIAAINASPAAPGANATSSSILNNDASDRYITSIKAACEGVGTSKTAYTGAGLATFTLTVSTTSTAAPAAGGANSVGGGSITIATSTTNFVVASSTSVVPGNSSVANIWAAGSYLTFTTNATNTAVCTFGADYMGS